ncbi:MAG TPA: carboxypeptidase regulatory-like domain-containing protein [Blastocatellia bacterium]|nr:carboxypeptidase regulatory-like domain-containing protein [Blastocatellia bacterium]
MLKRLIALMMVAVLLAVLTAACGKKKALKDEGDDESDTPKTPYVVKGNEGTITGTVSFEGEAPKPDPLDPSSDAFCNANMPDKFIDNVKIKDGKLADVFVYVTGGGLEQYRFEPPAEANLDQKGCRYVPRVLGLVVGQKLSITNSDKTGHNIHPQPKNNPSWNQVQGPGAPPIEKTFGKAEELIPVKCDQHPWMKAWISVLNHPFFARSEENGTYTISGVPPGTYTLVFRHEKFGTQRVQVTVPPSGTVTKDVVFKAGGGASPAATAAPLVLPYVQ